MRATWIVENKPTATNSDDTLTAASYEIDKEPSCDRVPLVESVSPEAAAAPRAAQSLCRCTTAMHGARLAVSIMHEQDTCRYILHSTVHATITQHFAAIFALSAVGPWASYLPWRSAFVTTKHAHAQQWRKPVLHLSVRQIDVIVAAEIRHLF